MLRRRGAILIGGLAVLTLAALPGASAATPPRAGSTGATGPRDHASAAPSSIAIPVDRQDYVTDTPVNPVSGDPVDPYNGDPTSIHVSVNGGTELARSFVHVPLDYLPQGSAATGLTLQFTVTTQSDAANTGTYPVYNTNTGSAIIEACALTTELPVAFNPDQPPAYDCAHGSAVGVPNPAGTIWTFNLHNLLAYWHAHGDTGAALIPIAPSPGATFAVAFYSNESQATATYVTPSPAGPAPAANAPTPAATPANQNTTVGTGTAIAPSVPAPGAVGAAAPTAEAVTAGQPPTSPRAAAPPTTISTSPASGNTAAPVRPVAPRGSSSPTWPWVLALSLAIALGSLGYAHRARVLDAWSRIFPPVRTAFRAHPRSHTLAAVAAAWGLIFTGYSLANQHSTGLPLIAGAASSGSAGADYSSGGPAGGSGAGSDGSAPGGGTGSTAVSTGGGSGGAAGAAGISTGANAVGPARAALTAGTGSPGTGSAGTGGTTSGVGSSGAGDFSGPGTWRTIDGIPVFFPANGGPPAAKLYSGSDDTVGITPSTIKLCAHAALTYGSAFNISASDLNVYWQWLNAHGGIFGRQVDATYQNDNYDPGTAVQAAQACKDWGTFVLMSGIGFDQVPAVRQWAEQNQELYLYTTATSQDTQGLRYSFTYQPSVEQMGTAMGQLAVRQFQGEKVGIIYRNSSNWTPGVSTFEAQVKAAGMKIVGSYPVVINQGSYSNEIVQLQAAGAQVVFVWENALADVEIIKQMQAQSYHPALLLAAFNLITNTLGSTSLDQPMWSAQPWDAYDPGYYGGGFASYAGDIHQFEAMYQQYDPNASLTGDGGDLLFQTWEAWKEVATVLQQCGPDCTRNRLAGMMLAGFDATVSPNCNVNFNLTPDHHHGGYLFQELHVIKDPNGRPNFVPLARCVSQIG